MITLIISCKKSEDRICMKSTGEWDSLVIPLTPFNSVSLGKNLVFELVQDSTDKVVVLGGRNLLNQVKVSVLQGLLEIRNQNKCNFLRSYKKKITIEIHFTGLSKIVFEGTEKLYSRGKLKFEWLDFLIRDGAGSVKLDFDAKRVYATISQGWGDFTFSGSTHYANLNVRNNGYCDLIGMNVYDSLTIISNTQGDIKVSANGIKLNAESLADGDIFYKGNPSAINFKQLSGGKLIQIK